jgi:hypothetical protein
MNRTAPEWRAAKGTIGRGRIIVHAAAKHPPPPTFFERPASTYTVHAIDGGNRARRFANVVFDRSASEPPKKYAFD